MPPETGNRGAARVARDFATYAGPSLLPAAATLLALAGVREGETVADVGCGAGVLTHPAAAAAGPSGRVFGIDCDERLLAVARDRRPSPVAWLRADAARLPVRTASVDKLLCASVLHRVADVRPVLAEWARALAPGGRVAVSAWGAFSASPHEDALVAALAERGVDGGAVGRGLALAAAGAARPASDLPDLLREAGLRVGYDVAEEVTLPFGGPEPYAHWRLSFPRVADALGRGAAADGVRAAVVAAVAGALGDAPVLVHSRIQYATATTAG
ncbi:MAG TPA: methyltransferase domain-containing protein [Frankiaceae bacterium]|nr:methyltransferase domain-containing protein [Frankiaceae bacterium]